MANSVCRKESNGENMKTLLIGDMKKIDRLYFWMKKAAITFDISLIISENELQSQYYTCAIEPMTALGTVGDKFDIAFICSNYYHQIEKILLMCGMDRRSIIPDHGIRYYLSKGDIMRYYEENWRLAHKDLVMDNVQIGEFSYAYSEIHDFQTNDTKLTIGKFCSVAAKTVFMLGGEHRTDWYTTYPFNENMEGFKNIKGHPKTKGDIVIENDVCIGFRSLILSGVHIGNGSIIMGGSVITKDVEPYTIAGGNPARTIRKRFDEQSIKKLEEIQWWNWEYEYIYDAIPILQSNQIDKLFMYYDTVVKKGRKQI